jgi:predicted deacylase
MSELLIGNTGVALGTNATIKLPVGKLPSGTKISMHVEVFRSALPGPVMLVLAGVHGDEINSVEIVRQTLKTDMFKDLVKGSVIVIPILNIYGFINFSRDVPDGKDVNRSFPGRKNGSLASRVAWALSTKILPLIDFGVDYHTGGSSRYNYPQIRYSRNDSKALKYAASFAAPYSLPAVPIAKSLRKEALKHGKTILVFEGGEALRFDDLSINEGILGLRRLLNAEGMLSERLAEAESVYCTSKKWLRAANAGMFMWYKSSGEVAEKGDILGAIYDPYGGEETKILAKEGGFIIGHNNAPVVNQGDALFHIASNKLLK